METPGFIDSKFRLAILAAKRAKQLVNGAKKKIDMNAENPLTIALEEVYRGKISFQIFEEEEELAALREAPSHEEEEDILEGFGETEVDETELDEAEFEEVEVEDEDEDLDEIDEEDVEEEEEEEDEEDIEEDEEEDED